jgi:acetylornithine/LysW-gamma-L-lysine aminotransferase
MTGGFVFSEKPIRIERGDDTRLYADDGTEYLDAGASYACVPAGHGHPAVVDAVTDQLGRLTYVQGSYPTPARDEAYAALAAAAPDGLGNVWLANSGTEANEAALKFARHATGRETIVSTMQGFHGRTMGALAATWKQQYKAGYEPLAAGIEFVPYGDGEAMAEAVDEETAAVIVEPIQGEGGVNPAPEGYLETVREATADAGAAMVVDEIQTGLGRTGSLWSSVVAGVTPDVITAAKGLANGLPVGATLCADWLAEDAGDHGSTFSGGPAVSAAVRATVGVIEDDALASNAADVGGYLADRLRERLGDQVRDVRGAGLMLGVEVKRGANAALRDLAIEHNVLALPAGRTVLRLLPPLTLTHDDADAIVEAVAAVMGEEPP